MQGMDSEVYAAVVGGDLGALKRKKSTAGDEKTPNGNTILHLASERGLRDCVKWILKKYPDLLMKPNYRDETALHLAAGHLSFDVVRKIIDAAKRVVLLNGSTVEILVQMPNIDGDTALHKAVKCNNIDAVKLLAQEVPNWSHSKNKHHETPLYIAANYGYRDIIKALLDSCRSSIDDGPYGRNMLHAAVINQKEEGLRCMELILRKRRDLLEKGDDNGKTALHYAATLGDASAIEVLVKEDKSVAYLVDKPNKRTPLHIAASKGHIPVMEALMKTCPDLSDTVDGKGRNILHIAVENDHKKVIKFILENYQSVRKNLLNEKDENGDTPLHLLAKTGCYVPALINHELADPEALNNQQLTPLGLLYSAETLTAEQQKVRSALEHTSLDQQFWIFWRNDGETNMRRYKTKARVKDDLKKVEEGNQTSEDKDNKTLDEEYLKKLRDMNNTHMIVAALITTVTFTAGFTVPGGFDSNAGSDQGLAVLSRKAAFKAFMLTDLLALIFSTTSMVIYFIAALYDDDSKIKKFGAVSATINVMAMVAMMIAFITGTNAVLSRSTLAISLVVIGCLFFLILFCILGKRWYDTSK